MTHFWQINLVEFDLIFCGFFRLSRSILLFGLQFNYRRLLDNPLHRHCNELIKWLELLSHQTLFIEIGRNDRPATFLPGIRLKFKLQFLQSVLISTFLYDLFWRTLTKQNNFKIWYMLDRIHLVISELLKTFLSFQNNL